MPDQEMDYIRTKFESADNDHQTKVVNEACVGRFGYIMKDKLAEAHDNGRSGWQDSEQCSIADLRRMFDEQVLRAHPDFADVANFAMMLHFRTRGMVGYDPTVPLPETSA